VASHEANVTGTLAVLEACRERGTYVVAASSSSVYGSVTDLPKHEDLATRPLSPYAASKLAAEGYLLAYSAAFGLPALGFAVGPMFEKTARRSYEPVGTEADFTDRDYTQKVITLVNNVGEAGKTTVYVRRANPKLDRDHFGQPYVAISNRCMHVGCPIRYVQASQRFICPCHGGIYDFQGIVIGGPPVRPLDRFRTRVRSGVVEVGRRFSVTDALDQMYSPRDPSNHLDGLWKYLYPPRPTT
jgi:Rieske Fe-S protein